MTLEQWHDSFGDCPGGRRGFANAVGTSEAAAPDLRSPDGDARHPRARAADARAHGRGRRPRCRAGHQEGAGAGASVGATSRSSSRPCSAAPATRRWSGSVGLPGRLEEDLDDTSTVVVLPGDTPLLRAETLDELVGGTQRQRVRGHADHLRARRPHRLRPRSCERRRRPATAGCCASSSSATPTRTSGRIQEVIHQHVRVPPRPARARRCATSAPTTRRASTTSPT